MIWSAKPHIGVSKVPRVLRDYFKRYKIKIIPSLEVDDYAWRSIAVSVDRYA